MTDVLTEDEIAVGDVVSTQLEKMWGWYLAGGIIAMIFGFFVISYRHASVYAIVYLASGFFIAGGLLELIGGLRAARQRWPLIVFGVIWIGAGIVGFVWPHITIFIVAVLVGWSFLVLGIFDIVNSIRYHYLPYWWAYLIRGIIAVALGFLCIRHPGAPLTALVVLIGIGAILFGAVELIGAFSARHATKHWEAFKAQAADRGRGAAVRLASFSLPDGRPRPGVIVGDEIVDLSDAATGLPPTMAELVALGSEGLDRARAAPAGPAARHDLSKVRRHAPVPDPPAILAIGMNYRAHVAELGREPPEWQYWFNKQRTSISGPGRSNRVALGVGQRGLRGRAGARHRPPLPARAGGAGIRGGRRLHHHQRRQRARLAMAFAHLHPGEVLRHPRPVRPRAGDR